MIQQKKPIEEIIGRHIGKLNLQYKPCEERAQGFEEFLEKPYNDGTIKDAGIDILSDNLYEYKEMDKSSAEYKLHV